MVRVALFGYYGRVNLGDEAILESVCGSLLSCGISPQQIAVASHDPADTIARHGLKSFHMRNPVFVVKTILWATHSVFGGGGYHFRGLPLIYELVVAVLSRVAGKRVCVVSIGVEPIKGRVNQLLTRLLFWMVQWVTVRDEESLAELRSAGVRRSIQVSADPVWAFDRPTTGNGRVERPYIVCSFLDARKSDKYRRISPLFPLIVDNLILDLDVDVCLVATSDGEGDLEVAERIVGTSLMRDRITIVPWTRSLLGLADVISGASLVVSMRYHVLLLASLLGRPCAAISRSPKIVALARSVQQTVVGDLSTSLDDLVSRIESLYHKHGTDRDYTKATVAEIQVRSRAGLYEFASYVVGGVARSTTGS